MTIAIGKTQEKRGWFDVVDDWLTSRPFRFRRLVRIITYSHVLI